jgi:hypothetical protein
MKQKFVNLTMANKRKGTELHSQTIHSHLRPESFHPDAPSSMPVHKLPVKVMPPKKAEPSELDKMKEEILKAMKAVDSKPRPVPKSKLIGMGSVVDEPSRDYNDILAMLLAKK